MRTGGRASRGRGARGRASLDWVSQPSEGQGWPSVEAILSTAKYDKGVLSPFSPELHPLPPGRSLQHPGLFRHPCLATELCPQPFLCFI